MTLWIKGAPETPGIFWFDNGIKFYRDRPIYSVVKATRLPNNKVHYMSYGHFGGGPLSMIYSAKHCPDARYMPITAPDENDVNWKEWPDKAKYGWVKDKDGYISFGLFRPDMDGLSATLLYIDHPTNGAYHGAWLRKYQGLQFIPVKKPK